MRYTIKEKFENLCLGIRIYTYDEKTLESIFFNASLLQKARDPGLIISKFLEIKLQEYLQFANVASRSQNRNQNHSVGPLRFELKSLAPQARRIPSYPTGPKDDCYVFSWKAIACILESLNILY